MRTWFYANLTDEILGITIAEEIEVALDVSVSITDGVLLTDITDVLVNGRSLYSGTEMTKQIAAIIRGQAEAELMAGGPLFERVRDGAGVRHTGINSNDPDGEWKQVA